MRFQPSVLKTAREESGMSMEQLASKAEVSIGTVHNLETGNFKRGPGAEVVTKIASALGRDWTSFFGDDLQESKDSASPLQATA